MLALAAAQGRKAIYFVSMHNPTSALWLRRKKILFFSPSKNSPPVCMPCTLSNVQVSKNYYWKEREREREGGREREGERESSTINTKQHNSNIHSPLFSLFSLSLRGGAKPNRQFVFPQQIFSHSEHSMGPCRLAQLQIYSGYFSFFKIEDKCIFLFQKLHHAGFK